MHQSKEATNACNQQAAAAAAAAAHLEDAALLVHVDADEALPDGIDLRLGSLLHHRLHRGVSEGHRAEEALHVLGRKLSSEVPQDAVVGPAAPSVNNPQRQLAREGGVGRVGGPGMESSGPLSMLSVRW